MNLKHSIFLIFTTVNSIICASSGKKKQLMSASEVVTSVHDNLTYIERFVRIILSKESEQAKRKCAIALKNLTTLALAIEKGNIPINALTLLTLNGLIWHPDPCSHPIPIIHHLELYNFIKNSKYYTQMSYLRPGSVGSSKINTIPALIDKNDLKNTVNMRSNNLNLNQKQSRSHSHSKFNVTSGMIGTQHINTTDARSLHYDEFSSRGWQQNKTENATRTSDQIKMELEELSKLRIVSRNDSSAFKESLSRLLSSRN
ncbi:hypothetical protein HWI79_174 [Cryptosporidium felis]|nr:hypothetical protein HWI79_174 [Cryptosporidium felis]